MPSQNKTKNIKLNQWQENEYPKMIDFNEDNALIDKSIAEIMAKLGQLDYVTNVELVGSNILITKNGNTTKIEIPKGFSGNFNDLQNVPDFLKADWNKIENKPSTYPSTWENVSNKPTDYPTNWDYVKNKPLTYPSTWDTVSSKPSLVLSETLSQFIEKNKLNLSKKVDKGVALSNVDLNQIFEPNFYSARSCSNMPKNSSSYGTLIVTKADLTLDDSNTDTIQIYIDKNSNMYIRNCIDQTANWTPWKEYVSTTFTGELNNLQTENKTSLVSAINEVFQFGVDKGNKIISKLNALFDKDFKNLNQIAEEINKCKISSILQYYSSIEINDYYNCLVGTKIFNDNKFYDIEQKKYLKNGNFSLENNNDIFYKLDRNENKSDYQYLIDSKNNSIHNDYYGDLRKYSNSGYGGLYIKLNGKLKIITINKYNDDITEILGVNEFREESFKTKGKLIYANDGEIFYYDDENKKLYIYNHNFQLKKSINVDDFVKRCYFIGNVYVYDKYYSNDEDKIKIYDKTWSLKRSEEIPKKMFSVSRNVKRLFGLPNSKELYFYQMYKNKYSNYDDNLKGKIFFYKINENGILTKENTFDNFLLESCDIYYNKKFIVSMNFKKEITIFKISKVLERK